MDMEKHVGYVLNADIRRKWQKQIKQAEEAMEMYKSPIEIMLTEMQVKMENGIMKAVRDVGVNVDATELLKALAYDREQYKKGFADGQEAGYEWISAKEPPKKWENDDGTLINYLVYMPEYGVDVANYLQPANTWVCLGVQCKVTHWMPLPEPPKEE